MYVNKPKPTDPRALDGDARVVVRVLPDGLEVVEDHRVRAVLGVELVPRVRRAYRPEFPPAVPHFAHERRHIVVGLLMVDGSIEGLGGKYLESTCRNFVLWDVA